MQLSHTPDLRTVLKFTALSIGVLIVLGYTAYQARFLIIGPVVTLETETNAIYNERIIEIHGKASNISSLTLNGRRIFTDETGVFREPLVLENGYTIMSIRAEDRYGRETVLRRSFVYRPASSINL